MMDHKVSAAAPSCDKITAYDRAHFLTYARLLDAEQGGDDWRAAARRILGLDPNRDTLQARACFRSHLARARWILRSGYSQMLEEAGLS